MKSISFLILGMFPSEQYGQFTTGTNDVAIVEKLELSNDGQEYSCRCSVATGTMHMFINALNECGGRITDITPQTEVRTTPAVKSYIASGKPKKRKTGIKIAAKADTGTNLDQLQKLLKGRWVSVNELKKDTGWIPSSIHARFVKLREMGVLKQKLGPDNLNVYSLKTAA